MFDPFLGVAIGTRFREKAPVGSAIDELKVFKRELAPVEVAFLHDENAGAGAGAAELATAARGHRCKGDRKRGRAHCRRAQPRTSSRRPCRRCS